MPNKRLKTYAAVLGGSAVVAMCALATVTDDRDAHSTAVVSSGSMETGETVTVQYSATLSTSEAVPTDKATPYGGSGS